MKRSQATLSRILVLVVLALLDATQAFGHGIDHQTIEKEWKQRELSVRAFEFEWTSTVTYSTDKLNAILKRLGRNNSIKAPQVSYEMTCSLWGVGSRLKYTFSGTPPSLSKSGEIVFNRVTSTSVFNGTVWSRVESPVEARPYPQAETKPATSSPDERNETLKPLFWWYRPLDAHHLGGNLEEFTIQPGTSNVGDRPCIRLVREAGKGSAFRQEIWIDPERGFNILKYVSTDMRRNAPSFQVEVTLSADDETGWVPAGWTTLIGSTEKGRIVDTSRVMNYSINPAISDEEFGIEMPIGAVVTDYSQGEKVSVLRRDGTLRPVSVEERTSGRSYDDILNTEPPHQRTLWRPLLILNVIVVVGLLMFYLLRRRKAHQNNVARDG